MLPMASTVTSGVPASVLGLRRRLEIFSLEKAKARSASIASVRSATLPKFSTVAVFSVLRWRVEASFTFRTRDAILAVDCASAASCNKPASTSAHGQSHPPSG